LPPQPVLKLLGGSEPVPEEQNDEIGEAQDVDVVDVVLEWAIDEKRPGSCAPFWLNQDQRDGYDLAVSEIRLILRRFGIQVG
jgi:hypothetical protein